MTAPEDIDYINDVIYALFGDDQSLIGKVTQTDYDSVNNVTLPANGEVSITMRAPGVDEIQGQAVSTGQNTLRVEWLDANNDILRTEGIYANRPAEEWSDYSLEPKSPFVRIVLENDTSIDQTATLGGHMR